MTFKNFLTAGFCLFFTSSVTMGERRSAPPRVPASNEADLRTMEIGTPPPPQPTTPPPPPPVRPYQAPSQTATPSYNATARSFVDSIVEERSWWQAGNTNYGIGYEGTGTSTSALAQNAVVFGMWPSRNWGFEAFLGFTKSASTTTDTAVTADTQLSTPNTRTVTTTYSGTASPSAIILGGVAKYRLYQTSWFQFYVGFLAALVPGASAEYSTGTRTETYADVTNLNNRSVSEAAIGTVTVDRSAAIALGPKVGTEFYLKWLPHLALGFSSGILTTLGGGTRTTTATRNKVYTVTNGVDGAPTTHTTSTTVANLDPGTRGATFGIGGTNFQITGIFTLRYIW